MQHDTAVNLRICVDATKPGRATTMNSSYDRPSLQPPGGSGGLPGIIAAVVAGAIALVLGVFFFAVFLALILVAAVVISIRVWWLRRRTDGGKKPTPSAPGDATILEGEYRRVDKEQKRP